MTSKDFRLFATFIAVSVRTNGKLYWKPFYCTPELLIHRGKCLVVVFDNENESKHSFILLLTCPAKFAFSSPACVYSVYVYRTIQLSAFLNFCYTDESWFLWLLLFFVLFNCCFHFTEFCLLDLPLMLPERMESTSGSSFRTDVAKRYAVKLLQEYLCAREGSANFEVLDVGKLNLCLADFYTNVTNRSGGMYSKNSLIAIRQGIRRHLQNPPFSRCFDIVTDSRFRIANNALRERIKTISLLKPTCKSKSVESGFTNH